MLGREPGTYVSRLRLRRIDPWIHPLYRVELCIRYPHRAGVVAGKLYHHSSCFPGCFRDQCRDAKGLSLLRRQENRALSRMELFIDGAAVQIFGCAFFCGTDSYLIRSFSVFSFLAARSICNNLDRRSSLYWLVIFMKIWRGSFPKPTSRGKGSGCYREWAEWKQAGFLCLLSKTRVITASTKDERLSLSWFTIFEPFPSCFCIFDIIHLISFPT